MAEEPMDYVQVGSGADTLYNFCAVSELAAKLYRYKRCTVDLKREPGPGVILSAFRPSLCAIINAISVNPMQGGP